MQQKQPSDAVIGEAVVNWVTLESMQYDTLGEARKAFDRLPIKTDYRIAEAYTMVRYKPVKR